MSQASAEFIPTRIAILTVSSRRGEEDDTSGHWLRDAAQEAGHAVVDKAIVKRTATPFAPGFRRGLPVTTFRWCSLPAGPALPKAIRPRKRCCRCLTGKLKALARCSACSLLKRSAPRRCSPAPLPAWLTARLFLRCPVRPKPAAPRGKISLRPSSMPAPARVTLSLT